MVYLTRIQKLFGLDPIVLLSLVKKSKIPVHICAKEDPALMVLVPVETVKKLKVHNECEFIDKERRYNNSIDRYEKTQKNIKRSVSYGDLIVNKELVHIPLSDQTIFYAQDLSLFLFKNSFFKISGTVEQEKVIKYFIEQCKKNNGQLEKYDETPSPFFYDTKKKEDRLFYKKVIVGHLKDFFRASPRNKKQSLKRKNRPKHIMRLIDEKDLETIRQWFEKTQRSQ